MNETQNQALSLPQVHDKIGTITLDPDLLSESEMDGWQYAEEFKILSTTGLSKFARCPRLFFYTHVCGLMFPSEALPLKFGEAIHAGLPYVLAESNIKLAIKKFEDVWGTRDQFNDDKRNTGVATRIFMHALFNHSNTAKYQMYQIKKPLISNLAVTGDQNEYEIPFVLRIPGCKFLVGSRIDALSVLLSTGEEWVTEFKTASSLADWTLNSFELNTQLMLYVLAARTLYNQSCPGVLLHAFHVAKAVSKTTPESIVKPIYIKQNVLDDFVRWVIFQAKMIEFYIERKDFPKQFSGCSPYSMFGVPGGVCEFKNLCYIPNWTTMRNFLVKSDYKPFRLLEEQASDTKASDASYTVNEDGKGITITL